MRISFVGGGSDIPNYYTNHKGAVISTSIDKYVYISVNQRFENNIRLSYNEKEIVKQVSDITHPIIRNTLDFMEIRNGIEITSVSDIHSNGTGLGSSSTFTVALLHALYLHKGLIISKEEIARLACHIELDLCNEKIGKQDQYAASFGGFNLIEFNPNNSVNVKSLNCKSDTLKKLQDSLLFFYTGINRKSSSLLVEQTNNLKYRKYIKIVDKMVDIVYQMEECLIKDKVYEIGELLDRNWSLKSLLSENISNSKINDWYSKAISAGALGGKILGAGNGGFLMFLAEKEKHDDITKALGDLRKISISFENSGSSIIFRG